MGYDSDMLEILENGYFHDDKESKKQFLPFAQFWDEADHSLIDSEMDEAYKLPPQHKWLRGDASGKETSSSGSQRIPKIINKIYIEKSGRFPTINEMKKTRALVDAHKSWPLHNAKYQVRYFNLHLCRHYLKERFHPIFLRAFDCLEGFANKADFFRMLVVYADGGW